MADTAPLERTLTADLGNQGTAGASPTVLGEVPFNGVITSASFTPEAAIVGNASDYRTLKIINKGSAGSGTLVAATKAFSTAGTAAANDEIELTVDTARDDVSAGDVLVVDESITGGGLINPGGLAQVTISRG